MFPSTLQEFLQLIIATVLIALLVCYHLKRTPGKLPPGPYGFPLLGVLPLVGKYPERVFAKWAQQYGPVISVRMGTKLYVVLNNYDSVHQALLKKSDCFSGRPFISLFDRITEGSGLVLVDYGPGWKLQKKFGVTVLRGLGIGKRTMEERIIEELAFLNDAIRSHEGKPFDILSDLSNAVANNICSVVMGRRFEYEDPIFEAIIDKVRQAFSEPEYNRLFTLLMFAPALVIFPPFSHNAKKLIANINAALNLFRESIEEHENTFDQNNLRDFIDSFLYEVKQKSDPTFTKFQLMHYIRDLFVAGTETTTSTLRWGILCLIHYPEAQTRIREEIYEVIGEGGTVNMSHKSHMPYINAFIQELYRFRSAVPLNVAHKATADVELQGYFIPKGTTIIPNLWAVHNDPSIWQEPDKFKPERHLDHEGNFILSPYIIPFSIGGRRCLGEQLGRMAIFMFLVSLIQKFVIMSDPVQPNLPDIVGGSTGLVFTTFPFNIVAKELK